MQTPSLHGLDAWVRELDRVRLPLTADLRSHLRLLLHDSRRSLRDLAEQVQRSPVATLALIREANRHTGQQGQPAATLEVALHRLGLHRSAELLAHLPVCETQAMPRALRQLLLISRHAVHQAEGLFALRLARLWQEVHCASLLLLSPFWPLAAAHPQLLEEWEQRVLGHGEPATKVEHQLFGVTLLQLAGHLAELWRLPEWVGHCYRLLESDRRLLVKALRNARDSAHPLNQQQRLDADPSLRRWLTQPANSVLLANSLALSAHVGWGYEHSLRWQRLTALHLRLPLPEVQQHSHQLAAHSARQLDPQDLWHPAVALLWPWADSHLRPPEHQAPPPKTLPEWRRHCTELLREPSPFLNVVQLTACARDALNACGLPRVLMLLADRQRARLRGQQASGLNGAGIGLELDPAPSPLLRRLLDKPAQLRLSPANMAQYSALLPGPLKALFPSEHLLLRSLAHHGRVVMLLVADREGLALDDFHVQAFDKTALCIERALAHFISRKG